MKKFCVNIIALIRCVFLLIDTSYEKNTGKILSRNNLHISTAESCTGGLLSSFLTDVSGSSDYINANFVTYANEAKESYLSLNQEILQEYGAVSPQTARAMVEGLLENTKADYAAATTGIAGPSGGSVEKPVGLVYIGVGNRKRIIVRKFNVNPLTNRRFVKIFFFFFSLKVLYDFLKENEKCTD